MLTRSGKKASLKKSLNKGIEKAGKFLGKRNPGALLAISGAVAGVVSLLQAGQAEGANTTYVWTGGNSTWNTATNWNSGAGPVASGAGNIVKLTTNNTITLDAPISIGVICIASAGPNIGFNINSSSGNILTMDGTGVTIIRGTGVAGAQGAGEAYLGAYQNNSNVGLLVNTDVNMASNLGIGGSVNSNYVTVGGGTANTYKIRNSTSTTKTLNLRAQSTGAITINSSIGTDQTQGTGGIDIIYTSNNSGAATINGNIGGATGTGQAITITNSAANVGNFNITGALGQSITSISQTSTTSTMAITSNAGNTNYANGFTVKSGTLALVGAGGGSPVSAATARSAAGSPPARLTRSAC